MYIKDYNTIEWNKILYYDTTSPTCLRWGIDIYSGNGYNTRRVGAGDVAGYNHRQHYILRYQGAMYQLHRIIWILHYGSIENNLRIDHIDGNGLNNLVNNLRLVSPKLNNRNRRMQTNNKSGVSGVRLHNSGCGYIAQWVNTDGKTQSKYFSISSFGEQLAFEMACNYRKNILEELKQKGEGYTDRHGL